MRFLLEHHQRGDLDSLARLAEAARDAGLDGVLVSASPSTSAALVAAAALSSRVEDVLVAAEVELGERHPVEIAEEAAVTDLSSGGRLILVVRPAPTAPERFAESLDVIRLAFGARPFRFAGEHWRVPANLAENLRAPEHRVRVTPAPAQPRLEVWVSGAEPAHAVEHGIGHLADLESDEAALAAAWEPAEASPASLGAPRGRRERWEDAEALLHRLREGRAAFGQDWACVTAPPEAAHEIGSLVRPRVQLDRLPPGLEDFWQRARPWE